MQIYGVTWGDCSAGGRGSHVDQSSTGVGVCANARGQAVKWNQLLSPGPSGGGVLSASPFWFCGAFTLPAASCTRSNQRQSAKEVYVYEVNSRQSCLESHEWEQDDSIGYHPQQLGHPPGILLPNSRLARAAGSMLLRSAVVTLASGLLLTLVLPGRCCTSASGIS